MVDDDQKDALLSELKDELRDDIEEHLEHEIEAEVAEEVQEHLQARAAFSYFRNGFIAVAATIMALGQFSEAVTLIESGVNWSLSKVTHRVEYQLLDQIHVGNTEAHMIDLLGNPQVSKAIDDTTTANYYHDDKYLLTVFIHDARVVAFTIIPLLDDFTPRIQGDDARSWDLQQFTYADYPAEPELYLVDHSKAASYYLEVLDTGRTGLFYKTYLGNVSLLAQTPDTLLVNFYKQDVYGEEADVIQAKDDLRRQASPNVYGLGALPLEHIQKSMLTAAEFSNYFGY